MAKMELIALSSKVILKDNILTLNELNIAQKHDITSELIKKMSNILSGYYSSNITEWNKLIYNSYQ